MKVNSLFLIIIMFLMLAPFGFARELDSTETVAVPCAIVKDVQGEVEILGAEKSSMSVAEEKSTIACGSWVSVKEGWVILEHRQGVLIKVSSNSFFQVFDNFQNQYLTGNDHVVLYKGKLYLEVPNGLDEFRVATSNAVAKLPMGKGVVIYSKSDDETQLISLENRLSLQNRFVKGRSIFVNTGEATGLNSKIKRVVPTTPKAINIASIKEILDDFPLNDEEMRTALVAVRTRLDQTFASLLLGKERKPASKKEQEVNRVLASSQYDAHPVQGEEKELDQIGYQVWVKKILGGKAKAQSLLFPEQVVEDKEVKKVKKTKDPALFFDIKDQKVINKERDRLIDELKKLNR